MSTPSDRPRSDRKPIGAARASGVDGGGQIGRAADCGCLRRAAPMRARVRVGECALARSDLAGTHTAAAGCQWR